MDFKSMFQWISCLVLRYNAIKAELLEYELSSSG